ncbi:Fe2+-dependent dioxygenase [Methylocella sp. CPCC 101449]|uniref:Fe2+-dependent dioxygenase n=1 Tax=Methylocella sp. CPCC 101449 TaxID=2987531 RepID=UPI00288C857C|nr:Fe2+-dependent dioxygenase [Methylocella sp. CPCC 101449]MDT2022137.1 Fe2+-dependent dioxygenase [Methylocella sp. CPCC 101449]
MMTIIPDVLSKAEARQIHDLFAKANWTDGRHTAGHVAARVKHNDQLAQDDPLAEQVGNFILERLAANPRFTAVALPLKVLPPRFNRYAGSGSYGDHIDASIFGVPQSGVRIRGDLSATLFISEPEDYDGGELLIQGEMEKHRVKLPAGQMILYPANTIHQVTSVTRGARFASFFWLQSLVKEDYRRRMLLDLDETIQALSAVDPEQEAVTRLTGLYHNLLRDWSAT